MSEHGYAPVSTAGNIVFVCLSEAAEELSLNAQSLADYWKFAHQAFLKNESPDSIFQKLNQQFSLKIKGNWVKEQARLFRSHNENYLGFQNTLNTFDLLANEVAVIEKPSSSGIFIPWPNQHPGILSKSSKELIQAGKAFGKPLLTSHSAQLDDFNNKFRPVNQQIQVIKQDILSSNFSAAIKHAEKIKPEIDKLAIEMTKTCATQIKEREQALNIIQKMLDCESRTLAAQKLLGYVEKNLPKKTVFNFFNVPRPKTENFFKDISLKIIKEAERINTSFLHSRTPFEQTKNKEYGNINRLVKTVSRVESGIKEDINRKFLNVISAHLAMNLEKMGFKIKQEQNFLKAERVKAGKEQSVVIDVSAYSKNKPEFSATSGFDSSPQELADINQTLLSSLVNPDLKKKMPIEPKGINEKPSHTIPEREKL